MLMIHLPLNGDLHNQGLANIEVTNNGATVDNNGKIGKCYSFDGTSKYISLTNPFTDASEISCSIWIKPLANTSTNEQIMNIGTSSGWNNIRFGILQRSNNQLLFHVSDGTNNIAYSCYSSAINLNEWIHIVCTYKNRELKMYLNGELAKTYSISFDPSFSGISKIGIGAAPNGAEKFTGFINDVKIFSHCLSQKEISELKKMLILHYPLDGNNGTLATPNLVHNSNKFRAGGHASGITPSVEEDGTYKVIAEFGNSNWNSSWWYEMTGIEDEFEEDDDYTVSFWIKSSDATLTRPPRIYLKSGMGYYDMNGKVTSNYSQVYYTGKWKKENSLSPHLGWGGLVGTYYICRWKLEKGTIPTLWCPNSTDSLYTALGYDDGIEYDTSGYGNNGTKIGTLSYSTDSPRYLASTVFDGTNNISFPIALGGQKDCTIAFWAKPNTTNASGCMLSLERNTYWQFTFYGSHLEIRDSSTGYTGTRKSYSIGTLVANTWTHICVTYSSGILKIYRDGEMLSTNTVGGTNLCNELNEGRVGSAMQSGYFWSGNISDVRVYASCLSDSDIQKLYTVSASIDSNGNAYSAAYVEG